MLLQAEPYKHCRRGDTLGSHRRQNRRYRRQRSRTSRSWNDYRLSLCIILEGSSGHSRSYQTSRVEGRLEGKVGVTEEDDVAAEHLEA